MNHKGYKYQEILRMFRTLTVSLFLTLITLSASEQGNAVIPAGSLKDNMGVSPIAYVYSDWAYLITKAAHKTEQLGGLTLAYYNHIL